VQIPVRRPAVYILTLCLLLMAGACSQQDSDGGRFQALTDYFSSEVKELTDEIADKRRELDPLPDIPWNAQQTDRLGFRSKSADANAARPPRPTILLDLGSKQSIDSVVLVPADAGSGPGYGFPIRFKVEVSDDLAFDEELRVLKETDEDFPNPRNLPVMINVPNPSDPIETRYVRITATRPWTSNGRALFALGELMVLHGGRNLAAGLPEENVKATNYGIDDSDEVAPSWGRANLVDSQSILGMPQGRKWSPHNGYQSLPDKQRDSSRWVKVDLGRDAPLHEIRLFPARSADLPSRRGFGFPERYKVEIATDADPGFAQSVDVTPGTGVDIPNPLENPVSVRVRGTVARYVKFTATSLGEGYQDFILALSEMQVFSGGENIALNASVIAQNTRENKQWSTAFLTDGFNSLRNILSWPEYIAGLEKRRLLNAAIRDLQASRRRAGTEAVQSVVAWSVGVIAGAIFLSLVLLWRHRLARRHELSALRRRLAQDIHDEIGSGLGTISLLSQMGGGNDDHPEVAREEFTEIHRLSRTVTESLRDIVWFIHPQNRTVGDLAQRLQETAHSMLAGMPHDFKADCPSLRNELPLEHKRQILMFFKEALHNIIRHSGAPRAEISMSGDDKHLRLVVHDHGCGFDPAAPRAGAGMTGMKQRAKTLGGRLHIETVSKLINSTPGLSCTHLFATGEDALRSLGTQAKPGVILLDVGLPGMNGIEFLIKVREAAPESRVVILTAFEDEEKLFRAICSGASGYLLKTAKSDEIIAAIREAHAGGALMTPSIAKRVFEMFSRMAPAKTDYGLSEREKLVLEKMVGGLTKKEIAAVLDMNFHTVDAALRSIYSKLEVNTRTGAVAKALKEKLV
jgi:DNA-binding NarL/FixJ family response regulator/signal transduction histidine kinase